MGQSTSHSQYAPVSTDNDDGNAVTATPGPPEVTKPAEAALAHVLEPPPPMSPMYQWVESAARTRLSTLASTYESCDQVKDRRTLRGIIKALEEDCISPYAGVTLSVDNYPGKVNKFETPGLTRLLDNLNIKRKLIRSGRCWSSQHGEYHENYYNFSLGLEWKKSAKPPHWLEPFINSGDQ